jgi:hypothetical protein
MRKSLLTFYKIPLLLSVVLTIVLLALNITRDPFEIASVIFGVLVGTFVLDSEYLIHAYLLEPKREFSKTLVTFLKHGDFKNAIDYLNYNKDEIKDKTLNSALFQIAVAGLSLFVISSTDFIFVEALVLSIYLQSLYKFSEYYFNDKLDSWFWMLKDTPSRSNATIYAASLIGLFAYCLFLFS